MAFGLPSPTRPDGPEQPVGVEYVPASAHHPPLRIYYPAQPTTDSKQAGWFDDTGVASFLEGYVHTIGIRHASFLFQWLVRPLVRIISFFLPMTWMRIPGLYRNVPLDPTIPEKSMPIVIFSHGLTGTGQESTTLCTAWARAGRIVVSVHHTDGSSCQVRLADGSSLFYQPGPPFKQYDRTFRPRQLEIRAREMRQAFEFLVGTGDDANDKISALQRVVDPSQAVAAGYSFGAATATLAVIQESSPFKAAIYLDGWFFIDVRESAGISFCLPEQAFRGEKLRQQGIPSLFLNSHQFSTYPDLFRATQTLAKSHTLHVIPDTGHQNFCDTIYWVPTKLARIIFGSSMGSAAASPEAVHQEIERRTLNFLDKVDPSKKRK